MSIEKSVKNEVLLFICYEVVDYLAQTAAGKDNLLKNKGLHEGFRRRLKEAEEVSKIIVRILY